ncbi:sarcosine oxidase subunit gamma [Roseovarius sp. MMSF_3281]|uniref:sarcosine oxidase subunit gamma n=1 Tax=Roseovarius sp. MMSF_3281 TaxID=3046694 RepID=UPI00273EC4D8|nr:sarcosine oxidase subunit gamma family protein [Roseovarius sp. MMSF_3281]
MPEFSLISAPPLAGYDETLGGIRLRAPEGLAIVSIALPLGGEAAAEKAVKSAYGAALPEMGQSVLAGDARLVRLGVDQAFVIFDHTEPNAEGVVAGKLKDKAYTTDQTDVWVGLEISGAGCREALERICPLDLHPDAFAVNQAARTVMEHLGVLIIRTGEAAYLLLSASSSAGTFQHALHQSMKNVS